MDKQTAFDIVVNGARAQRCRSKATNDPACLYRGPKGRKCFAGMCIPDDIYSERIEGNSFRSACQINSRLRDYIGDPDVIEFINSLQVIHDLTDPVDWEQSFAEIATANELTIPEK